MTPRLVRIVSGPFLTLTGRIAEVRYRHGDYTRVQLPAGDRLDLIDGEFEEVESA